MFIVATLRSYGARTTLRDRIYRHLVPTGRRQLVFARRRQFVVALRHLVCAKRWLNVFVAITIALSFVATLIPVASAALTRSGTMACCAGKAGHCDSGIAAKKVPPPKSEPMCGLHGAEMEDDGITIVAQPAEPSQAKSQHSNSSKPAAESASLSQPCHMNCASCATAATRPQKRDRNTLQTITLHKVALTTLWCDEDRPLVLSSNFYWKHFIPRGPPSDLR